MRLGVRVDARHLGRVLGQHGRAVSLAAGHVDDPQAARSARRSSGRRPGGAGTSSSPPARRAACARRSARAAARPAAGCAVRRWSRRPVSVIVRRYSPRALDGSHRPNSRHRADPRREHPLPRRGRATATTPSGRSTTARSARGQVLGKLSKALGRRPGHYPRALEIGAGTGYFSLNLLRQGVIGQAVATDISPGMLRAAGPDGRRSWASRSRPRQADAEPLPFAGRVVRPRARPRRAAPPARARQGAGGVPPRARAGRHARVHGRAVAPRRPPRGDAEAARRTARAGMAPGDARRPPTAEAGSATPAEETYGAARGARRRAHVHARRPAASSRTAPASWTCGCRGRSCWRTSTAGSCAGSRPTSTPTTVPLAWHRFAFRSYLALQWVDGKLLEPRLPAELFYNLLLSARKPGLTGPSADPYTCPGWHPKCVDFPLFPLPLVLLPTEVVPLHIFEERYKAMIALCLDEQREFGIVWLSDDGLKEVGCTASVAEVLEQMEDGRMNILVRGGDPVPAAGAPGAPRLSGRHGRAARRRARRRAGGDGPRRRASATPTCSRASRSERPEDAALAELCAYEMAASVEIEPGGEAGPARAALRGGAAEAAGAPVQGRHQERRRGHARSPTARPATARSTSASLDDDGRSPPRRGSPAPDSSRVARSRRAACAPPK